MRDGANGWDFAIMILWFLFAFSLLAGTVFLIQELDWSPWWLAFDLLCMPHIRTGKRRKIED